MELGPVSCGILRSIIWRKATAVFALKIFRAWLGAMVLASAVFCGDALRAQEKAQSGAVASPVSAAQPSAEEDYRMVAADVVKIDVWKNPDISRTIPVDRDGDIDLPLAGVLKASGLSAMQLASLIRGKLVGKVDNPQVTITVVRLRYANSIPSPVRPVLMPLSPQFRDSPSPVPQLDGCPAPQGVRPA
jgi:hypothetical protein